MSKQRWRESLQRLCENHTDPREDEQLKLSKIEIQNRVSKTLKLVNDRRPNRKNRNGEGNSRRESELCQLVEDLSRQYQLIYDLHFNLRSQLSQTYNDVTEEGFYTAGSDSEPEPTEDTNQEIEVLKQKLTLTAQEKEFSLAKIEELENETTQLKKKLVDKEGQLSDLAGSLKNLEALVLNLRKAMEEQLVEKDKENCCLQDEMDSLREKVNRLQNVVLQYGKRSDIDQLEIDQLKSEKVVLQGRILEVEKKVQERGDEVNHLQQQMTCEREKCEEKLSIVEKQNTKLTSEITELEKQLQERADKINDLQQKMTCEIEKLTVLEKRNNRLEEECKLGKTRVLQAAERKMEEMAAQFKKSLEANITILRQRIRVAEQVQTENKESFKSIKERCFQQQMISTSKAEVANFVESTSDFFERVDYKVSDFSTRISWVLDEISVMKDWVTEMKLDRDECTVLSSKIAEKEDEVKKVGEEKKEAIRQLCMSVEYHQNRCDQLIKLLSKTKRKC